MDWSQIPKQKFLKENGDVGDCWRCCIAAMIGLPADEVPHFLKDEIDDKRKAMDPDTQMFLNERGWAIAEVFNMRFNRWSSSSVKPPAVIAAGPTSRSLKLGEHHAVIMQGGKLLYDPHPSGSGLTYVSEQYLVFRLRDEMGVILKGE